MYLLYAGPNEAKALFFESVLFTIDKSKTFLSVPNGYELLCFLQKVKRDESYPAIIILEKDMPRLCGAETLELLKSDDIYRLIPVYILYTKASEEDLSYFSKLGADCLKHPNSSASWKNLVSMLCERCEA